MILGAGRANKDSELDYGAGFLLEKKVGDQVKKGDCVARIYGSDKARMDGGHGLFPDRAQDRGQAAQAACR